MFPNVQHQSPPQFATTSSGEADTKNESKTTNDGASVEVVRRRRGRPPGTKNKPKSSVSVTREPDPCMSPYVLEVADGSDIISAVTQFCNHRNISLCVMSGSGCVSNVSFRGPITHNFRGRFNLVTISATVTPSSCPISAMLTPSDFLGKFVVSIASPQGQMLGGVVVGPLIATGKVYIVATTFNNPLYHQLPIENNDHDDIMMSGDGYVPVPIDQSLIIGSDYGDSEQHHHTAQPPPSPPPSTVESLLMYGCQFQTNFEWQPVQLQHSSLH